MRLAKEPDEFVKLLQVIHLELNFLFTLFFVRVLDRLPLKLLDQIVPTSFISMRLTFSS